MEKQLLLTDNNFKKEVFESRMPVLVDFWASWCPPCKMVEPVIEELAIELDNMKIGKINVDQNPKIQASLNITGVPTFILFKDGRILKRGIGAHSKQQLINMIKDVIQDAIGK